MSYKEKISDYFDGIVEVVISESEQHKHDSLVKKVRDQTRHRLAYLAKKHNRVTTRK